MALIQASVRKRGYGVKTIKTYITLISLRVDPSERWGYT